MSQVPTLSFVHPDGRTILANADDAEAQAGLRAAGFAPEGEAPAAPPQPGPEPAPAPEPEPAADAGDQPDVADNQPELIDDDGGDADGERTGPKRSGRRR